MHNITIPENSSSNCYDAVVYSFLKYCGFDHEAYNAKYFYTQYYNPSSDIFWRICRDNNQSSFLKDVFGVDLVYKAKAENPPETADLWGIIIDPYWCRWSPFYQKTHYSHSVLIVDIDQKNREYICFDVHFDSHGYIRADFDAINDHYEYQFTFDFEKATETKPEAIAEKIKVVLDGHDHDIEKKKTELTEYFALNDRESLFPASLETSVPLINLMWIAEDKKHFPMALRYIERKTGKTLFSDVYDPLAASEKSFLRLRLMLLKYAMTGVLAKDKLESMITQIYDTDAYIVEKMQNALRGIM